MNVIGVCEIESFPTFVKECFGTLSLLARSGSEIVLVFTSGEGNHSVLKKRLDGKTRFESEHKEEQSRPDVGQMKEISLLCWKAFGISQVHTLDMFDFQTPSQQNVNRLRSLIDPLRPDIVFLPFLGSRSLHQRILAKSALIAGRPIPNLLMYNPDASRSFNPHVVSVLSERDFLAKQSCFDAVIEHLGGNESLHLKPAFHFASASTTMVEGAASQVEEDIAGMNKVRSREPEKRHDNSELFAVQRLVLA
jgi:hypothetical protein